MVWSGALVGHQWSGIRGEWEEGLGVVPYVVKICLACGLVLKKELMALMIEIVVILSHLGVTHLRRPQKIINNVTPTPPPPSTKMNNRSFV